MILKPRELWKAFPLDNRYEVSTYGNVRISDHISLKGRHIKERPVNQTLHNEYLSTAAGLVHRLVAITFITQTRDDAQYVHHIDGVKTNNHVSNLMWVTFEENMSDPRIGDKIRAKKQGVKRPNTGYWRGKSLSQEHKDNISKAWKRRKG